MPNKLVLIGCGGVGRAVLELLPICRLLPRELWQRVFIIEPRSIEGLSVLKGHRYVHLKQALEPKNIERILGRVLTAGDIVIDASVNVDAIAVMRVCHRKNCLYVDSSVEDRAIEYSGF